MAVFKTKEVFVKSACIVKEHAIFQSSFVFTTYCGLGSSVGIATDYGLDGLGSNPGGDEIFRPSRTALCPTQPPVMGTGSFPGVKCGRGVLLTTHHLLVPRSWKSRAIPLTTSGPHRACNGITLPLPLLLILQLQHHGGTVVKVLCYKSEGRWFNPSWCQWNFSLT